MGSSSKTTLVIGMAFAAACGQATSMGTTSQAVTSTNGLFQNGLTTNGVYQNGVYQNGVYQNGVYQNGVYQNGVYQNGVYQNGVYQNGVYQNGVYVNGVYQNGVYQNGVYQNGAGWTSGLWANQTWLSGTNADAMRNSPYTRQFFQYVYACAFPAGVDTTLDPNNGTLACAADGTCASGYSCSAQHTCVVPLKGIIGVGVNGDGSTWASSGQCDESCQRWVSACVLARTNAYGVHVDISMRAPDDAPDAVKAALAVTDSERAAYPLREGAYYGNVFASIPTTAPPSPGYTGPITGQIVATPSFYACAGPGSNIPEITKRFCSSMGDQAVIPVPGVCLSVGQEKPVCSGEDSDPASPTFGAIRDCYTSTDWSGLTPYKEVITVYLKQPISVCGNAVCEASEADATSPAYCPSDCHVGSWARLLSNDYEFADAARLSAVDPVDGSVVVASDEQAGYDITVDNGLSPMLSLAADSSPSTYADDIVVAKYDAHGNLSWAHRYNAAPLGRQGSGNTAVAIAPDHSILLLSRSSASQTMWLAKLAPNDGSLATSWPTNPINVATLGPGVDAGSFGMQTDASGNIALTGVYYQSTGTTAATLAFGATTLTQSGGGFDGVFVAKLSPQGAASWARDVMDAAPSSDGGVWARAVAIDGNGDVLAAGYSNQFPGAGGFLFKLDGATGATAWSKTPSTNDLGAGSLLGVVSDPNDASRAIYAAGNQLAKIASDGTVSWVRSVGFSAGLYGPAVDATGNVVVVADSYGSADLGAGLFNVYHFDNLFVASYSPTGQFRWAKHLPTILGAALPVIGFTFPQVAIDARDQVHVSGMFAGSMQLDDRLLVSLTPETRHGNTFVGAFAEPSPTDTTPPIIGDAIDQSGMHFSTLPGTIIVEATSAQGATVFFMPPTAIDAGDAGTNVTCSPAPNTTFPIGTTTVTCTASDPVGNSSTAQFHVVVRDSLAPILINVPGDTTSATHVVSYAAPTAFDQVDGAVPVTCTPASGATFAGGTTLVTCTASDHHGNTIGGSFHVSVSVTDTTPPAISVPAALAVQATGPSGALVTYASSATDDVDGPVAVACTPASGTQFPLGATPVRCSARDSAGNVASASFTVTVQDTTPPILTLPSTIVATATSAGGATVTYTTSALDVVDGSVATNCSPASGAQFPAGATTVSCSATDAHGNRATATFQVDTTFAWSGVLQPINQDGSSIFKLGSTVPVKFQLTGASAGIANLVATLQVAKISNSITGDYVEATSNASGDSGNTFRYDTSSQTYIFNLSTKSLSVGTWSLQIVLPDGVARTTNISLR